MSETTPDPAGPVLVGLVVGDEPAAWRAAGFTVEDDEVRLGRLVLRLVGTSAGRGVLRWATDPPVTSSCDGLQPAEPAERPVATAAAGAEATPHTPAHRNGVVALDHVVVATDDLERTTETLGDLGLQPRRTVVGIRGDGDDELAYRFFLMGTCVLELVGPTRPAGDGPARFSGLAFTSTSLEELGGLAGEPRDAVQPGRRIATLRGEPLGVSVPLAFLSPRPGR